MANLGDHIRIEIQAGNLGETFTVEQIKNLGCSGNNCCIAGQQYSRQHVGTILANHSIGPGDRQGEWVKRGSKPLFIKHEQRATYSLNRGYLEQDDDLVDLNQIKQSSNEDCLEVAPLLVDHVRNLPFRQFINTNRGGKWYPEHGPITGWLERLNHYSWNGRGWAETQRILHQLTDRIAQLRNNCKQELNRNLENEAQEIYDDIRTWGNPRGTQREGQELLAMLEALWKENQINLVDSTLTKLYAMSNPDEFVIYDSRVAASIVTLAEDIFRMRNRNGQRIDTVFDFQKMYPNLGTYGGVGGTRPRGTRAKWPNAYGNVDAQLQANALCKSIVVCLNEEAEDNKTDWNLREVEAVLFMDGY